MEHLRAHGRPASMQVYGSGGIPGWRHSLLMPALKDGQVFRIALDAQGNAPPAEAGRLFETVNRYRDVLVSADGRTFYVATDNAGLTTGADGAAPTTLENPGAILVFTAVPNGAATAGRQPQPINPNYLPEG